VEYPEEGALTIYTDGSMLSRPRRGGAALLFVVIDEQGEEQTRHEMLAGFAGATQNEMELEAVIEGLKIATGKHPPFTAATYRKILVKTDSQYVAANVGTARTVWSRNGWTTREGRPIDNAKQWKELVRLLALAYKRGKPVTVEWVPGKKSPRTKTVDKLAKRSAATGGSRQLSPAEVRRKRSENPIEIGSIPIEGQMMTIHIFKSEYQSVHRLMKYWYSVESKRSPHYARVSTIYSEIDLRRRVYRVRVNRDTNNPRIVKVFGEVTPKPVGDSPASA
jgi:ribonuclease HI